MNQGLITSLSAVAIAQLLKPPLHKIKTGIWDWGTALDAGGMPSSHTAGVTSLATYLGIKKGVNSVGFAMCTVFSLIIMYDAMGVRKHTGEIAIEVNEHDKQIEELVAENQGTSPSLKRAPLKVALGHQPTEVLGGLVLGIVTGGLSYLLSRKSRRCK